MQRKLHDDSEKLAEIISESKLSDMKVDCLETDFCSAKKCAATVSDASLLIKEIIMSKHRVNVFIQPPQSGKTLNLSMIDYFFNIDYCNKDNFFNRYKIWECNNKTYQRYH